MNLSIKLLFVGLIMLGIILWTLSPFSSFGEKFTVSMIGAVITVLVINKLIAQEKKLKFKKINKVRSEDILSSLQVSLMQIIDLFKTLSSEEAHIRNVGDPEYTKSKLVELFESEEYSLWFQDLKPDQKTYTKLNELTEKLDRTHDQTLKSLEKIQPYSDPELTLQIREKRAKCKGKIMAVNIIAKEFIDGVPEELKKDLNDSTKEKEVEEAIPVFMKMMASRLDDNSPSLEETTRENLLLIQSVIERAAENNLEFVTE